MENQEYTAEDKQEQEQKLREEQEDDDWLGVFGELSGIFPEGAASLLNTRNSFLSLSRGEQPSKDDCGDRLGEDDTREHQVLGKRRTDTKCHPQRDSALLSPPLEGGTEKEDSGDCLDRSDILLTPHVMGVIAIQGGWTTVDSGPGPQLNLKGGEISLVRGHWQEASQKDGDQHRTASGVGGWLDKALVDGRSQEPSVGMASRSSLEDGSSSTVVTSVTEVNNYSTGKQQLNKSSNNDNSATPGVPDIGDDCEDPPPFLMSTRTLWMPG